MTKILSHNADKNIVDKLLMENFTVRNLSILFLHIFIQLSPKLFISTPNLDFFQLFYLWTSSNDILFLEILYLLWCAFPPFVTFSQNFIHRLKLIINQNDAEYVEVVMGINDFGWMKNKSLLKYIVHKVLGFLKSLRFF